MLSQIVANITGYHKLSSQIVTQVLFLPPWPPLTGAPTVVESSMAVTTTRTWCFDGDYFGHGVFIGGAAAAIDSRVFDG